MLSVLNLFITGGNNHINLLYIMLVLPVILGLIIVILPQKAHMERSALFVGALIVNALGALGLCGGEGFSMLIPWGGFGMHFALRVYGFSTFIIFCTAVFALLIGIYSLVFMRANSHYGAFFCFFLLTVAFTNGAVLANNLVVLLFFWAGHLIAMFAMIIIGNRDDVSVAIKALVISTLADLLLLLGIAITVWRSGGVMMMDEIAPLPLGGLNNLGFVLMMLGALGKAGAIPFHTWIPDAAKEAPLPFMALLPGSLDKLLGIYLAMRVARDFYDLTPGSDMSLLIMIIGIVTIVLAVAMAMIQKDMKRLLSYHAVSQVGYMALGIGTALPIGMAGALFHMLNHSIYKSALFLSAGAVERSCGETDLRQIGGLRHLMPLTTIGFVAAACSISGLPPFNGFFSKELIFDAALQSGLVFYIMALLGAFMTAASFLKLGHAAFFGHVSYPQDGDDAPAPREAPAAMFLPLLILALLCLFLGLFNALPLSVIQGILGEDFMAGSDYSGWPHSIFLVIISLAVMAAALLDHFFGMLNSGEAVKALDHIRYAPGLRNIYNAAEKRYFDPYEWLMIGVKAYAKACFAIDRAIDWIYNVLLVKLVGVISAALSALNDGHSFRHIVWAFSGLLILLMAFLIMI